MVAKQSIDEQLKKIDFNTSGWGRTEVNELPSIILPDEKIFECVNGIYEGGFALLVGTNIRVMLIDKKPLNYLTVEDLRFDMINEIDYNHRLFGARISISTGSKTLKFSSLNQQRLRKLINHIQHHMADSKMEQSEHQKGQNLHLERINQQLQSYLLAQHQQQQELHKKLMQTGKPEEKQEVIANVEPVRPDPQLSDFLFAQSLMAQHQAQGQESQETGSTGIDNSRQRVPAIAAVPQASSSPQQSPDTDDLYAAGVQEIFAGHHQNPVTSTAQQAATNSSQPQQQPSSTSHFAAPLHMTTHAIQHALEINPLRIANSKLPMAMRNRKFGRPSFHSHSGADEIRQPDTSSPGTRGVAPAPY